MESRKQQILRTLSNHVRVLSASQISRRWWSDTRWGLSRAKESLWELSAGGLLVMQSVLARPITELHRPLQSWRDGEPKPSFTSLAKVLHKRAKVAPQTTTIVFATAKTVALFGEGRRPSVKVTQMTHDLHVSEVFLRFLASGLSSDLWMNEDQLPSTWPVSVRPDALLLDHNATPLRAIEYGGDYSAARLEALHDGFASIELGYELW